MTEDRPEEAARRRNTRRIKNIVLSLFAAVPLCAFVVALFPPSVAPVPRGGPSTRDMNNRDVPFAPPAKRVVIFPPILSDYVTIDQGVSHVVATSKPNVAGPPNVLRDCVFPAMARLPITGRTVDPSDPEIVLRMKPDAIFAWAHIMGSLKNLGFPAVFQVTLPQGDLRKQLEMWRMTGRVAGRNERAEALLGEYLEKIGALRALLPPKGARRLKVAILNASNDGWWIASGKHYYLNINLEWAGTENAAGDVMMPQDRGNIIERLLVLDPDVIVLNSGADHGAPRDFYKEARYQPLRAVRERRVYLLPDYMGASMVVKDPLLLLWMAEVFYPGQIASGLRDAYKDTYRDIYGYALSDDEIDKIIFLKENLGSAGYERFMRQGSLADATATKHP